MPTAREVFCHGARARDAQRELELRFFRELRMPNRTYKTTSANRLADFDDLVARHLSGRPQVTALDVGVASGVTTIDLANRLEKTGCRYRIVAVDRYLNAQLVNLAPGIELLLSADGDFLQLACGQWTRPRPQGDAGWKQDLLEFGLDGVALLARLLGRSSGEIALVTADLRNHGAIELAEQDIQQFRPEWEGRFDLVRGANVLNLSYFDSDQLVAMLGHLVRYLKSEGLLAICRSDDLTDAHHGSVFVKDTPSGSMKRIDQLGDGSEVRDLVLNLDL